MSATGSVRRGAYAVAVRRQTDNVNGVRTSHSSPKRPAASRSVATAATSVSDARMARSAGGRGSISGIVRLSLPPWPPWRDWVRVPDAIRPPALAMILFASAGLAVAPPQTPAPVSPPVWAKADNFWFRKAVPGGHVWLNVDALHGVKEPLFDHQRLAIELTHSHGAVEYEPLKLPFADPARGSW